MSNVKMKHPTPEQLQPLLNAVDTAIWAHNCRHSRVKVDFKGAFQDLIEAYGMFRLATEVKDTEQPTGGANEPG